MNWARNIKDGIERYQTQILPFIEGGFYGPAGMELQNSIDDIGRGLRESPLYILKNVTFTDYVKGLIGKLAMLKNDCLQDLPNLDSIKFAQERINEKIPLIEIMAEAHLD